MREPWPTRSFPSDTPAGRLPFILERLRGTPVRCEEKTRNVPPALLTRRDGHTWSIQENIAHLTDLEDLHLGRLDDFAARLPTLRVADLTNQRTWNADHNARPIAEVLAAFRASRTQLLARLERWNPADLEFPSLHPRLKTPMRLPDLAYFIAEHDDYHLARAHDLLTFFQT